MSPARLVPIGIVLTVLLTGCVWDAGPEFQSLEAVLAEHEFDPEFVVVVDGETRIGVRPVGNRGVEALYLQFDPELGWRGGLSTGDNGDRVDGLPIGMVGWGGADFVSWRTLVFGIGPVGMAGIEVDAPHAVGRVSHRATRAFFIVSTDELVPDEIRYRLLDAAGGVLFDGQGIGPAPTVSPAP